MITKEKITAFTNLLNEDIIDAKEFALIISVIADDSSADLVQEDKTMISIKRIVDVVAEHYNITPEQIISKNRSSAILTPRQVAIYLCSTLTNSSLQAIGMYMGGRDHSTVLHCINRIEDRIASEDFFAAEVQRIIEKIA